MKAQMLTSDSKEINDQARSIWKGLDLTTGERALNSYMALRLVTYKLVDFLEENGVKIAQEGFIDKDPDKKEIN